MGQRREIILLGNPVLRKRAEEVADLNDPELHSLVDDLICTMIETEAIGLAAPQVGISLRLFVMRARPSLRYPDAPLIEPRAVINPVILEASPEKAAAWEQCKSIPEIGGLVPRHRRIRVRYLSIQGDEVTENIDHHVVARIFQHEYDHLDGITFLERIDNTNDLAALSYVRALEAANQQR